jgi:hypothetical protein
MGPNTLARRSAASQPHEPGWSTPYGLDPSVLYFALSVDDEDDPNDEDDPDDEDEDDRRPPRDRDRRPARDRRPERGRRRDEDDEDEDDEDEDDPDAEIKITRGELERMKKAASRARKEAKERRELLQKHGINPRNGRRMRPVEDEDDFDRPRSRRREEPDPRAARRALRDAEERGYTRAEAESAERVRSMVAAVPSALDSAGFTGTPSQFTRALKLVDLDEVDTPEDLADAIANLKDDFPDWFRSRRTRRTPSRNGSGSGESQRRGNLRTSDRRGTSRNGSGSRGSGNDPLGWARNMGRQAGVISDRDD